MVHSLIYCNLTHDPSSLVIHNPINSHSILIVVAFSSFVGLAAFLWFFVSLFINLVMRKQTLILDFATRFCFVVLALRKMPIFT